MPEVATEIAGSVETAAAETAAASELSEGGAGLGISIGADFSGFAGPTAGKDSCVGVLGIPVKGGAGGTTGCGVGSVFFAGSPTELA